MVIKFERDDDDAVVVVVVVAVEEFIAAPIEIDVLLLIFVFVVAWDATVPVVAEGNTGTC